VILKLPELTLLALSSRGELNFARLVELLRNPGYILEGGGEAGCSFVSTVLEKASQEDFDRLFKTFFENERNDIEIDCAATDKGGMRGDVSYALFNSSVITRDDMIKLLSAQNRRNHTQ